MKLFYYKNEIGNFGDDLNPYIWYNICPEIFDNDDTNLLVGIGTLINSKAPKRPHKFIFGSGVGYHNLPTIDESWQFYCVRGPLSAQMLGLSKNYAITDPAILLTQIIKKIDIKNDNKVSFMPHHTSAFNANWAQICKKVGFTYIDPAADIHEIIFHIQSSKLLITEAMHGAIVADALRVPWVPVICYDHILDFKWRDWCASLNINYKPIKIPSLWSIEENNKKIDVFKNNIKHHLLTAGIWSKKWDYPFPKSNFIEVEDQVLGKLNNIAESRVSYLSNDLNHFQAIERLLVCLDEFKKALRRFVWNLP